MNTGKTAFLTSIAAAPLFLAATSAFAADSLSDSIEQFLKNAQDTIDETKIWKFQVKPSLRESVIWTDNIFLNDKHERNVILDSITDSTGHVTFNPHTNIRDFRNTDTQGRQADWLIQSEAGLDFILPVSDSYFTAFRQNHITLLSAQVKNQQYLDHNELDNTSVNLHSDVFGFLSDLLNVQWGDGIWVRAKDDYSQLKDPLDVTIRQLRRDSLVSVTGFSDFSRTENTANFDAGWNGNQFDASAGYEHYQLHLKSADLRQAEHTRQNVHAETGAHVPGWEEERVFLRGDYWWYDFARAPVRDSPHANVTHNQQILNDARVFRGVVGIEGPTISDKTEVRIENGYETWTPGNEAPQGGDRTQFAKWVGLFRIAYQPWDKEERNTRFQFEYKRSVGYSAISNFNAEHQATFMVQHEVIPKRLDADFTISFTSTVPSNGPVRHLLETGAGLTYHLYKQLDVSLRYLFRHETTNKEIVTHSAFARGGQLFQYEIKSDGAFYQNIVELGFLLHF